MSDVDLKPYSNELYHNEELKSLSRYRFDKVQERAKLKFSISRLVNILFPELEILFCTIHLATVYQLLSEYPGASYIANSNLNDLSILLSSSSKGRFDYSKVELIHTTAKKSIGSIMPDKSLELKHTIKLIKELDSSHSHMKKRDSRYLRYALFNATKFVCNWDSIFNDYLLKKRSEGKHYNVAISHATKKLVRVMFQLEKTGQAFQRVA